MIQDGIERVSNDRIIRFQTSSPQEWMPIAMNKDDVIISRDSITIGDIITILDNESSNFLVGQVTSFRRQSARTKRDQRFGFDTLFIHENRNVDFFLFPIAKIVSKTRLQFLDVRGKFYSSLTYINTINPNYIDMHIGRLNETASDYFSFGLAQ